MRYLFVVVVAMIVPHVAAAKEYGNCSRSTSIAPDVRIRACNELSGKSFLFFDDPELLLRTGQAYFLHRGVAYALQRKFTQAQADIDQAKMKASTANEELVYRIQIIDTHLTMIRNGVEPPAVLRDMLETKINITHQK